MKISYNPYQIRFTPLDGLGTKTAGFGYRYMDLSPREDFIPLYCHPRASRQRIARLRRSLEASGVELTALYGLFKWSSADEHERAGGSRYMRRTIEISAELECPVVSTEFGTSRNTRYVSENQFWRSMDETLPILERNGVELRIEPHPDDFVEDHYHGVDMVRAIDSPYVTYLYCVPHTHYLGRDIAAMIRYAGDTLTHIHAADTYHPSRYIANPSDTDVRLHQHLDIGQGDVDFDSLFSSLADIGFDGVISSCVTAWTERAEESARLMLQRISGYATRYGLGIEGGDTG